MKLLNQSGKVIHISPTKVLGDGHEAIVYSVSNDLVAKIYRDPSWYNDPEEQRLAAKRLADHQHKLPAFPTALPDYAAGPIDILRTYRNFMGYKSPRSIVGFLMPRVSDAEKIDYYMTPRSRNEGVTDQTVVRTLIHLHGVISALHQHGLVIGDLNHGNVLVRSGKAWAIDLDAGQFDDYLCRTFEPDYLDPRLMDTNLDLMDVCLAEDQFYTESSDWYSFACMVLGCLTYVKPYFGVAKDPDVTDLMRPHRRMSVFHPEVRFPEFGGARHWDGYLPENLVDYLTRVFGDEDMRGPFPIWLLENLLPGASKKGEVRIRSKPNYRWPDVIETIPQPKGRKLDLLLETRGAVDPVTRVQEGTLRYLISNSGTYTRDHGYPVIQGETRAEYDEVGQYRFHYLHGEHTVTVHDGVGTLHKPRLQPERFQVDSFGDSPAISSNGDVLAWYDNRTLTTAYDMIDEKETHFTSQFEANMVWALPTGRIVSYHRTGEDVELSLFFEGERSVLPVVYDHDRPRALRVLENETVMYIWSWHSNDVRLHVVHHDGTLQATHSLPADLRVDPANVALTKNGHLLLSDDGTLHQAQMHNDQLAVSDVLELPLKNVNSLLPHPHDGLAVLTSNNQIWQLR